MFTTRGGGEVSLLKLPVCIQLEGTVRDFKQMKRGRGRGSPFVS